MKNTLLIIATFLTLSSLGQEKKSKFFQWNSSFGGFGGVSFDQVNNTYNSFSGEGAFILGNAYFGGFGFGTNSGHHPSAIDNQNYDMTYSCGGLITGIFSNRNNALSAFAEFRIAWGALQARSKVEENLFKEYNQETIAFSPRIGLSYNIFTNLQTRLYGGYQFTNEINMIDVPSDYLNGYVVGIGIYLGSF